MRSGPVNRTWGEMSSSRVADAGASVCLQLPSRQEVGGRMRLGPVNRSWGEMSSFTVADAGASVCQEFLSPGQWAGDTV